MTSVEFAEWQAFQRLEGPLGPERDDWRTGLLASVIANANRDPKRTKRPYEPGDFIPNWGARAGGDASRKPDPLEVAEKVKRHFATLARRARGDHQ